MKNTLLDDISAAIGYTATTRLSVWFGGRCIYVPQNADPDHTLGRVLGEPAFRRLAAAFGGERIFVPKDSARQNAVQNQQAVFHALTRGEDAKHIATTLGISTTQVSNIRRELEEMGVLPLILREPLRIDEDAA